MVTCTKFKTDGGCYYVSKYIDNQYVDKTIVHPAEFNDNGEVVHSGKLELYFRNGEVYDFEVWNTFFYSPQGDVNVSPDGQRVYVSSDEKGLWCYTYKGEVLWKTRYTVPQYMIVHDDYSFTTELNKKIAVLDRDAKIIRSRPLWENTGTNWLRNDLLSAQIGADRLVLLDPKTLDIVREFSIKKLGIGYYYYCTLYDNIVTITGATHGENSERRSVSVDLRKQ